MPIQLRYTLSFEDYLSAQRLHARRNWWLAMNLFLARFVVPVLGICLILIAALDFRVHVTGTLSAACLGLGIFLTLYPWYYAARLKRCYRRTRTGSEEQLVEIGEESIHMQAEAGTSDLVWKAVGFFREDKNVFLLYLAPAKFILLPKRVLAPEQIVQLRSLAAAKCPAPDSR